MNILPLVMQFFGPVILNKIAGSLGINSTLAQKAIAAAAPSILAAIIGKTMQPGGAKVLADALGKQDPGILGRLGDIIGSGQQASMMEQGTNALGSVLGSGTVGSLAAALTKYAGLGSGASNSLLGLMAPAVLGTLGREQKSENLDAAGLANLLAGQKQQIVDAIPADFAKVLQGTGVLDAVMGKTAPAAAKSPAGAAPASTTSTAPRSTPSPMSAAKPAAAQPMPTHHHHFSWGPWLVALAAAAALWWTLFGNRVMQDQPTVEIPAEVPPSTTLATGIPGAIANTDIGKMMMAALSDSRGVIAGVKDAATAQAAVAKVGDVSSRLDKISGLAQQLSPEVRKALATYVNSQSGPLKTLITSVLSLPGVSAILKPALDQFMARLDKLAQA